jgi:EAL domain-containing protein (putative c-di-GMP-specific phosphodiesterase class I)
LAHSLGLKVAAEGVERPDQMECLRTLSCDFVQGQLLAPTLPAAGVQRHLALAATPAAKGSHR